MATPLKPQLGPGQFIDLSNSGIINPASQGAVAPQGTMCRIGGQYWVKTGSADTDWTPAGDFFRKPDTFGTWMGGDVGPIAANAPFSDLLGFAFTKKSANTAIAAWGAIAVSVLGIQPAIPFAIRTRWTVDGFVVNPGALSSWHYYELDAVPPVPLPFPMSPIMPPFLVAAPGLHTVAIQWQLVGAGPEFARCFAATFPQDESASILIAEV